MNSSQLFDFLIAEQGHLEEMIGLVQQRLANAPEGKLHQMINHRKYVQSYVYLEEHGTRKYIPNNNSDLIQRLAQKSYDKQILEVMQKRLVCVANTVSVYRTKDPDDILSNIPDSRRNLITPIDEPIDDYYIQKWKSQKHPGENTYEINTNIYTEAGEHVRSKSEKIIADKFYGKDIPYVYEPLLTLRHQIKITPDFVLLNKRTRQEFYFEHFGMMDNPEYSSKAIHKIEMYQNSGYWFGMNLLYTFETSSEMCDMRLLDTMIQNYLI